MIVAFGHFLIALVTLVLMEPLAASLHRHVMHGWGWGWHASHHRPRRGFFEVNDLYAVLAAVSAVLLFSLGGRDGAVWWIGAGVTLYGLLYALVHDGLVHRRFPFPRLSRHPYLRRLVDAHHLHHAVHEREGAVSFGFLYAPPLPVLRRRLKAHRSVDDPR